MSDILFVNELPVATSKRIYKYTPTAQVALVLKDHPNQWAKIRSYSEDRKASGYVFVSQCKAGKMRALSPILGFEVVSRASEDGLDIYARYVGA